LYCVFNISKFFFYHFSCLYQELKKYHQVFNLQNKYTSLIDIKWLNLHRPNVYRYRGEVVEKYLAVLTLKNVKNLNKGLADRPTV